MEAAIRTIGISLFGSLAEAIGREVTLAIPDVATVRDVRQALIDHYPGAGHILSRSAIRACIGDETASDDAAVPAGVQLGFLPPLSGG